MADELFAGGCGEALGIFSSEVQAMSPIEAAVQPMIAIVAWFLVNLNGENDLLRGGVGHFSALSCLITLLNCQASITLALKPMVLIMSILRWCG
jgi:hypothetical protein